MTIVVLERYQRTLSPIVIPAQTGIQNRALDARS
jgi:hypothetical protein